MVSPSRSSASRRRREDAGKFFTGFLLLLGLVASIFLVFSDNLHMIRVGLVAALWAAAITALAATRYRRESAIDRAKVGDLQKVYQLQLEREVAARREYELGVENRVRHEVGADAAEMAALRTELTVLRESLQRLFEGDLPFERPALRADAVRVQELPGRTVTGPATTANDNWPDADPWDPWSSPEQSEEQETRARITPVFDPAHPEPPAFATPFDDPVTAETSIVTDAMRHDYERALETEAEQPLEPEPAAAKVEKPAAPANSKPEPVVEQQPVAKPEPVEKKEPAPVNGNKPAVPRLAPEPAPATPMGRAGARRRRRADDSEPETQRLSVAEIMANLRSENTN